MNKDPIFHFPHASVFFLTCERGPVTRLDEGEEEGGGGKKKKKSNEREISLPTSGRGRNGVENGREQVRWRV